MFQLSIEAQERIVQVIILGVATVSGIYFIRKFLGFLAYVFLKKGKVGLAMKLRAWSQNKSKPPKCGH